MNNLGHIYFAGADPPAEVRLESCRQTKPAFARPRNLKIPGREAGVTLKLDAHTRVSPLLAFILSQSGLDPKAYKAKALNRRLGACLRVLKAPSEDSAIITLQRRPELRGSLLSALLIGVSEFFRDTAVFNQLKHVVTPELLQKNGALRVYSAGCSGGHELYSVAMILDEIGRLEASQLLGVDCRHDAIEQASCGSFAVSDLKGLTEERQQRYFHIEGRRATISRQLRGNTSWQVAGLGEFCDPKLWDVILFRNVTIYLELEYASSIWYRLNEQLKPGGVVVTGSADRPPDNLGWTRESTCIYRKSSALTS